MDIPANKQIAAMKTLLDTIRATREANRFADAIKRQKETDANREAAIAQAISGPAAPRTAYGFETPQLPPAATAATQQAGMNAFLESEDPLAGMLRDRLGMQRPGPAFNRDDVDVVVRGQTVRKDGQYAQGWDDEKLTAARASATRPVRPAPDPERQAIEQGRRDLVTQRAQEKRAARGARLGYTTSPVVGDQFGNILGMIQGGMDPDLAIALVESSAKMAQLGENSQLARQGLELERDRLAMDAIRAEAAARLAASQGQQEMAMAYAKMAQESTLAAARMDHESSLASNQLSAQQRADADRMAQASMEHEERMKQASQQHEDNIARYGNEDKLKQDAMTAAKLQEATALAGTDPLGAAAIYGGWENMPNFLRRKIVVDVVSKHNGMLKDAQDDFEDLGIPLTDVVRYMGGTLPGSGKISAGMAVMPWNLWGALKEGELRDSVFDAYLDERKGKGKGTW